MGNSFSVDILQKSEIKNNQVALWQGLLYIEFVEEIIWSRAQYGINKHE